MATTAEQKKNARLAKAGGYKDANMDGVPDVDPVTREQLAAQYQSALGLIYSVPEISQIFEEAVKGQWTGSAGQARFNAAVQNSNWYRENNQYFRKAWAAEHFGMTSGTPSADWQDTMKQARSAVQAYASQMGSNLTPDELDAYARRYVYEGWGESGRQNLMNQALSEKISYLPDGRGITSLEGAAGDTTDQLKQLAMANGVSYSDNWYLSAAKSVAGGLKTAKDFERDIREQAAGLMPVYGEKIMGGMNAYDLASPYIRTMAEEFGMSPGEITLNDPYIRQALTGIDDKGNPKSMNLWDFQQKLRQDPRWENTAKAQNEITSVTGRVMQMFGLMGRG